jgi:hypothetical protein
MIEPMSDTVLRIAVIDGVTFTSSTPKSNPDDIGAGFAAGHVRTALKSREPIERCLEAANSLLHTRGPTSGVLRDIPQATAIVGELAENATLHLVQSGDCEAWFRDRNGWTRAFPEDVHTPEYRRLSSIEYAAADDLSSHLAASRRLPDGAGQWLSAPIGRLPTPIVRQREARDVIEVVLATDGALLAPSDLDSLEVAVAAAPSRQLEAALPKGRDDVTVIRCRKG